MKKDFILAVCAAATLFTACSHEEELSPQKGEKGEKVNFVIGGPVTRTTTTGNNTTEFVVGDRIGIYATKGADGYNVAHEVGTNGTLITAPGDGIYYNGLGDPTANFYAYYPYAEQATAGQVDFTVNTNQSTEALFNANDFITAETTNVPVDTKENIELKFQHQLALIQLEVVLAQGVTAPESVLLTNCQPSISWKYKEGTSTTTGTPANIEMWSKSADGLTYQALVPPQKIGSKTPLLTMSANNRTYIFTTSSPIDLIANRIKKFKIGIGTNGELVVFSTDITAEKWTEDSEEITGDGTLVKPGTLLPKEDFSNFTATEIVKVKEEINAGGWYRFLLNPEEDKVEIIDEGGAQGKVMHFNRTGTAWHNGAYYFCAENVIKGRYVLKFKAKSSEVEDMRKNQMRIGAYMQQSTTGEDGKAKMTDYFAIIEKGNTEVTTVYQQILTFDDYADYAITFDLSKVSTVHNGTAANVTEESKSVPTDDMLKKVVLYLTVNTQNIDFYVDDISWEPAE